MLLVELFSVVVKLVLVVLLVLLVLRLLVGLEH
jgi:hypothetical protein